MEWFLVLMFWNPMFQEFRPTPGWTTNGSPSHGSCDMKMMYATRYLSQDSEDVEWTLECVWAIDLESAITIAQGHPQGDNI